MDRIVEIVVRLISALAGWARYIPGVDYAEYRPGEVLKILLVGYNGARNTGSDVRVAALARQVKEIFGDSVELSLITLDAASTEGYFDGDVRQIEIGTLFFAPLLKSCSEHHVAILCEGSTLKSKFADALTLYTCEAAGIMRTQGKPCIAYGSEVGEMTPYLERAVRDLCTDVRFAVRSAGSLDALHKLGFNGFLGTDTAWTFDSDSGKEEARRLLREGGWDEERPLLGIAPVNPFCWPVVPSLSKLAHALMTGERSLQYQAWYFFSWSEERARKFRAYIESLVRATATFAVERGFQPVIFGMEQLDAQACALLENRLGELGLSAPVLRSNERDGFTIAAALRMLTLLVTSRYHAQVLATESLVPTVAVSMDERLANLSRELEGDQRLLLSVDDSDLAERLLLALDTAYENADDIRATLDEALRNVKSRLDDMGRWLADELAWRHDLTLGLNPK